MNLLKVIGITLIFVVGIMLGNYWAAADSEWQDTPEQLLQAANPFQQIAAVASPKDRVPEKAIAVYHDRIVLDVQNAQWATFTDTHSMEPVIMAGANAIELAPEKPSDIQVGDIVSYRSEYAQGTIIHRVVYQGEDEQGIYYVMKGDNLPTSDPGRVRFEQIERVVVAIVY